MKKILSLMVFLPSAASAFSWGSKGHQIIAQDAFYMYDLSKNDPNIFTGPIFMSDDKAVKGVKIPYYFWKVIVRYKTSAKKLVAAGFIIGSGKEAIETEGITTEAKRINLIPDGRIIPYQVPIKLIESYTRLDFQGLVKLDLAEGAVFHAEAVDVVKPVNGKDDIRI